MSAKTTGAPSTKPPAVIGRESASFTGACAAPVLIPLCRPWSACFSVGFCWATPGLRSKITQRACAAIARKRFTGWLEGEDGIMPRLGRNPTGIFAQSGRTGLTNGGGRYRGISRIRILTSIQEKRLPNRPCLLKIYGANVFEINDIQES